MFIGNNINNKQKETKYKLTSYFIYITINALELTIFSAFADIGMQTSFLLFIGLGH